jgi:hypothetical protein
MFDKYNPEWIYRCYSTLLGTTLYGDPALPLVPISNPPYKPTTPDGPNSGRINIKHTFKTSSIEPDNDKIRYLFEWGDGNISLTEYHSSGENVSITYKWNKNGNYNIKVRAQDENGVWSKWSDPLSITMPKTNIAKNVNYREILDNLIFKIREKISNY